MAIHKKIDGEDKVIANNSIIDHNELSGREAYGAHPISAIRKLPEKLHALKEKDNELERKLVEHDTEADKKIEELETQDAILKNKQDYIEQHSQQIDFNVNDNLEASFRNYEGETKTFVTGFLPDEDTLTLNREDKIALQKVYVDDKTIEGTGLNDYYALRIKYPADEDTIITDTENKNIYATAIRDDVSKVTPKHIRDKEEEYENRFGAVTNELKRQDSVDQYQKSLIDDLQARTKGMGGWLNAYNFGKNPTKEDLTKYALQDIGITDPNEIYDGTRVRNLADDHIWVFDKETLSWQDIGKEINISDATNDGLHGLVTGSYAPYKGFIDLDGTISINGVQYEDEKLNKRIDDHEEWAEEKFTHYVTLDTDQSIHNAKTFEEDITLNKNLNIDGNINPTDNNLDIDGTVKPTTNNTYDLGSQTEQYKDLYLAGNLSNGDKTINIEHIADIDDLAEAREIALKYRGEYDPSVQYDLHDVVLHEGLYYISLLDNNVLTPNYDTDSVWYCLDRHSINTDKAKVVEKADTKAYLVGDTTNTNGYKDLSKDSQVYVENGELYDKRGVVSSKAYVDEQIEAVTSDAQQFNSQLRSDLDEEIRNREKSDNDLKAVLDQEIKDREAGDTSLQTKLDQEIQDRTDALDALEKKVNDDIQVKLDEQTEKLNQEIEDRKNGDTTLQNNLTAESEARTSADTTLQQNIDNEQSARETKDTELEIKLNKEIEDRTSEDKTLTDRLDNLKTSEIENDGDGSSPFATQEYVDKFGGKIDSISVNGKENKLPIDEDKNVDITIPTKTSDIDNDGEDGSSPYATEEYVVGLVSTNTSRYLTASADADVMSAIFASFDAVKAGPWYRNGKETTPTNNDYATFEYHRMVEGSEIPQHEYWRAIYQVDHETGEGAWSVQSKLGSMLTMDQQHALDSGITEALVKQITTNKNDIASLKTKTDNTNKELSDYKTSNDTKNKEQDNKITAIEEVNKTQSTDIQTNKDDITNLKTKTDTTNTELSELKTNLETNYYTKLETYTKQEVDEKFQNASAITIRWWA